MNFLAHAFLSGPDEKILVGNFIGDFIKGKQALNRFEPGIVKGVELHRAIDYFTDNHPVVDESKDRLRGVYRHYSSVIVDVFYDHFLALHWRDFHPQTLEVFSAHTYSILKKFDDILPEPFRQMFPYMVRGNWLVGYSSVQGIHRALSGMASRTTHRSKMEHASRDLIQNYDQFESEFRRFFAELTAFAIAWRKTNI